ncbi:glycosyltransferase family 4 protein [Paraburkholderia phenazinium]|uniref:Glycosyltransferase involved in cell wall bisynthesis n=1 Tax=Paraburkholderia phenazinium TaxID=60549 RepID=A0A1N6FMB2_9BURK|nr:glycosyltransferase family 4 protein [Paraburkholderia phenazinium]SIN96447.1 Glycosyltransferase involved in cell wall bisynthesis [Paraburkholderia phenazinium]
MNAPIDSLQIGMRRPLARPDGLDRMLQTMAAALPSQGVNVRDPRTVVPTAPASSSATLQTFVNAQAKLGRMLRRNSARPGTPEPERKPDVVALHFAPHAAPTLGKFGKVPRVVHFHGSWVDEHSAERGAALLSPLRYGLERMVYRGGTRHIVLSRESGDLLHMRYRIPEERIRVVPGCVDTARFALRVTRKQARKRLAIPQDRPVLLCVRPLLPGIGLEDLIDAIFVVKLTVRDVFLVIAGAGPEFDMLYARIVARGLENQVRLAGFVADDALAQYYRAADVTVVPTVAMKDCGLTAIESLAAGTPALVTAVGGAAEAVAPLSDHLVLPSGDYKALGTGIADTLLGVRVMPSADACRRYARKHFDHSVVAAQIARVYRDAIEAY